MNRPSALRWVLLALLLNFAGCATTPGIPDTVYYRLPPRAPIAALTAPAVEQPIVVETLLADGLHSDQAIIYSLDPDAARLKAYHYQLWVDPPVRLLQRRLIASLRDAGVARIVTDRLPNQIDALRIQGRLERFERVQTAQGWKVAVGLSIRADRRDGKPPLVMQEYVEEASAGGDSVRDSVAAMGAALDRIYAKFVRDLGEAAARD
jgi:cholesterol transport system auxiliary component